MYLSPVEDLVELNKAIPRKRINRFIPLNLFDEVDLLAFALMPNHIHILIKQGSRNGIIKFMRRLSTSYASYFNRKYKRIGTLFQSNYKAILVQSDEYLIHLSRYIHLNPLKNKNKTSIDWRNFSSYPYYLGEKNASWLKPSLILDNFKSINNLNPQEILSYQSFVEKYSEDQADILGDLRLEDNL